MIKLLEIEQSDEWNDIVSSFVNYDVYYLNGYVRAFFIHGDGIPQLLYYNENGLRAIYVYMKRKTSLDGVYDSISPYGYGGVIFEGDVSLENRRSFMQSYIHIMQEEHIVDNFVRYHPVIGNSILMSDISNVIDLGKTILMDISSPQIIWENIVSKNRNMIRKAEKNGVEIFHSKEKGLFDVFIQIYNATMDKDKAEKYYYFEKDFYQSIHNDLSDHYEMFYAMYEGQIIAMSMILFANNQMHYHLSGSLVEYRHLAPSNLLLYKAALWGCEQGFRVFHLGGGVGGREDSLYTFKATFNRKSEYQFSIGRMIFDQETYDALVEKRAANDESFDRNSSYFPLYRS